MLAHTCNLDILGGFRQGESQVWAQPAQWSNSATTCLKNWKRAEGAVQCKGPGSKAQYCKNQSLNQSKMFLNGCRFWPRALWKCTLFWIKALHVGWQTHLFCQAACHSHSPLSLLCWISCRQGSAWARYSCPRRMSCTETAVITLERGGTVCQALWCALLGALWGYVDPP